MKVLAQHFTLLLGFIPNCLPPLQAQPAAQTTVYAVIAAHGVFRSTDGGVNWTPVNQGLTDLNVQSLAIDPRNPDTLYAATGGGPVFKTTNRGGNWSAISNNVAGQGVNTVVVHPTNSNILYAARNLFFGSGGVFKSIDGGVTWNAVNNGLPDSVPTTSAALAIHPAEPDTLYASFAGTYKTVNGGADWESVPVGGGGIALAIDPVTPSTVLNVGPFSIWSMHRSIDDGANWTNITPNALNILFGFSLAFGPPGTVYAGTRRICPGPSGICGAVLKSTDSGATWAIVLEKASSANEVTNADVIALAVDPGYPSTIYAGGDTGFGLHRSTDGGANWAPVNSGLPAGRISGLAIPQQPPLHFNPVAPCRVADTRNDTGVYGGPILAGGINRTFPIPGVCGIPSTAKAYSLNVTVVPTGVLGFLTTWPTGGPRPLVSTLNAFDGQITANAAIVPAGTGGAVDFFATDATHLVVDINGYFDDPPGGLAFYPLAPCRVFDTRNPAGTFGGPAIAGGSTRSFPILSSPCGIPANAQAYAFNVTAVPDGPLAYLTAWPAGLAQPLVSTLNAFDGQVTANMAIVPAGVNGDVSFFATNTTQLVVDINGYFAPAGSPGALRFYTASPCRMADTRNAAGTFGGPVMNAGTSRSFPLAQASCGVPARAEAYSLNFTVAPSGPLSYLTAWPAGQVQPLVSTLNAFDGQITANAAMVPGGAGAISIFVTDQTHVIVDANGYFAP